MNVEPNSSDCGRKKSAIARNDGILRHCRLIRFHIRRACCHDQPHRHRLSPPADQPVGARLLDAYTPGFFELKFAVGRTRQAAPRVGLLVPLKTFQQLGYFARVADVPDSVLRQVADATGYDVVPQELDDYDRSTLRVRHMALVRTAPSCEGDSEFLFCFDGCAFFVLACGWQCPTHGR